jgi:hypothetical protein
MEACSTLARPMPVRRMQQRTRMVRLKGMRVTEAEPRRRASWMTRALCALGLVVAACNLNPRPEDPSAEGANPAGGGGSFSGSGGDSTQFGAGGSVITVGAGGTFDGVGGAATTPPPDAGNMSASDASTAKTDGGAPPGSGGSSSTDAGSDGASPPDAGVVATPSDAAAHD